MNVDIVRPGDDLSGYKLVLAPHLHVLADDVAKQLVEYVRNGGVLLADCRTGVKDETNLAYARTLPGLLVARLGHRDRRVRVASPGHPGQEETKYTIQADGMLGGEYTAIHYADWITPATAKRSRATTNRT